MKKIVLSIAGVMAAAAFAPEASAIPAFARQTGMACNACHQQHYPILNGFGRAFKASGYTMMGAQGKVEGDHISLPDTLNAALLLKARYQVTNGVNAPGVNNLAAGVQGTNGGQWQIPDEFSLFFGGRVAENIGFMLENNVVGGPAGGIVAGFKMPVSFDLGAVKISAIPFLTDALGVGYGYTEDSTGMTRGIRWMEHRNEISAQQYVGVGAGAATGVAVVAKADMGYINVTKFAPDFASVAGTTSPLLRSTFIRVGVTPSVGGWDMHIGGAVAAGTSFSSNLAGALPLVGGVPPAVNPVIGMVVVDTKATSLDFQAHGQVAGNDIGVYATYATAPGTVVGGNLNAYNAGGATRSATTIGVDYSVIPHTLHLGAAYRNATTGAVLTAAQLAAGTTTKDNAITVSAVYDLTQNVALHVNHSAYSGGARNRAAGVATTGNALTTFLLEAAF
jgi:hypothetical protein